MDSLEKKGKGAIVNRERSSSGITSCLISLALLALPIQSFAQSQKQPTLGKSQTDEQIIRCFLEYVAVVKVEITDQLGNEVTDLAKDDFIVYEDGVKQELIFWTRNDGLDPHPEQPIYEAGYYPRNTRFEGEFRKISVIVRTEGERKLKVEFSPKGYYAKKELRR